jgi:hypothetical protein
MSVTRMRFPQDARLTPALSWFNRNPFQQFHAKNMPQRSCGCNGLKQQAGGEANRPFQAVAILCHMTCRRPRHHNQEDFSRSEMRGSVNALLSMRVLISRFTGRTLK